MGTLGSCAGAPRAYGPHADICMLCTACLLMVKHWFCWKYQYNKYIFNFIDQLHFIPVSGCVGRGPMHYLLLGAYHVAKTASLVVWYFLFFIGSFGVLVDFGYPV